MALGYCSFISIPEMESRTPGDPASILHVKETILWIWMIYTASTTIFTILPITFMDKIVGLQVFLHLEQLISMKLCQGGCSSVY